MKKTITTHYDSPQDNIDNLPVECENCYLNTREMYSSAKTVNDLNDLFEQYITNEGKNIEKIDDSNLIGFTLIETIEN